MTTTSTVTSELESADIWLATLGELQIALPKHSFDTWLRDTQIFSIKDKQIVISVHSSFAIDWLERRMYQSIQKTLEKITGHVFDITFTIKENVIPFSISPEKIHPDSTRKYGLPALNKSYTFNTFIVGDSNELAFNAVDSISKTPGQSYNPLFIYSSVGLGKTHLLHAIGWHNYNQGISTQYTTAEKFTNEFINSIRTKTTKDLKEKYSKIECLLIDDIQFISGKEQTQEGFFHIFNELHNSGCQIVITSDKHPQKINNIQERLLSRFEWGLMVDIQPPNLETRIALLKDKAERLGLSVDHSIFELIARYITQNIRQLEGFLNKLSAQQTLMKLPITYATTEALLFNNKSQYYKIPISKEAILENISSFYKIHPNDLTGKQRTQQIAHARQITMYLLRKELNLTSTEIGRYLGNRSHATVIHAITKIGLELTKNPIVKKEIIQITEILTNN